jgi:hypothetical protein
MSVQGELSGRFALSGSLASVSRVAFSADGHAALLYVAHGQTSPGTSHFVLLTRLGGSWTVRCAAMRGMIIF